MLALVALCVGHVPTYTGGSENCYTPPHTHTTSQVIYLKGSGGLEIHTTSPTEPFDIPGGEILDVDAVFKKKYDQSTYSLYIGCGGCVASQDPIVIPPTYLSGYEHGEVEPFTQTVYYSVFPKEERKFNASDLAGCSENHFTIRVVDHANRTDNSVLVWGAVIGLGETFTFVELISFPIFVLRNHGDTWNMLGWTVWISFIFLAPLTLYGIRMLWKACGLQVVDLDYTVTFKGCMPHVVMRFKAREALYELALIGFTATIWEGLIHLVYAQVGAPVNYGLWVGLFGVIGFANGLPIFQVISSWEALKYKADPKGSKFLCSADYLSCSGSPMWAPIEILTGFSYLFLFGAGFYLGPAAIMLAGMLRLGELYYARQKRRGEGGKDCPPAERHGDLPSDIDPFFRTAPQDVRPSLFF
jgi:hypothetical protein